MDIRLHHPLLQTVRQQEETGGLEAGQGVTTAADGGQIFQAREGGH